jgi:hypothetical protein
LSNPLLHHFLLLYVPLILTHTVCMLAVKRNWIASLNIPVHEESFGRNKTYRGFALCTFFNSVFFVTVASTLKQVDLLDAVKGALLGFAYMVCELPNSYLKRRLGIPPGGSHPSRDSLFKLIDKSDSAFGVCAIYSLMHHLELNQFLVLFLGAVFTHVLFSILFVKIRLKEKF